MIQEPRNIRSDMDKEIVKDALRLLGDNNSYHTSYLNDITAIRDLDTSIFEVKKPKGNDRMPAALIRQAREMIMRRIKRPSATLTAENALPEVAQAARDGLLHIMDRGGFKDALKNKPAAFADMLNYGNGFMLVGKGKGKYPIKFSTVTPGTLYVDRNATVLRSESGARQLTRGCIIYTYDYAQARALYPNKKFGKGRIPRERISDKPFDYSWLQYEKEDDVVEIGHFFDIGGKKPRYAVFAGSACTILEELKEDNYPVYVGGNPWLPLINLSMFDANEGFFDYGFGQAFYRYAYNRKVLFEKAFSQAVTSMNGTKVLNVPNGKGGEFLKKIQDSLLMASKGEQQLIINDTGQAVTVDSLEAAQLNNALQAVNEQLINEMALWGVNLRTPTLPASSTATQILELQSIDDEFIMEIINKNTQAFKDVWYITMEMVKEFVPESDNTPIPTSVRLPEEEVTPTGEIGMLLDQMGRPVTKPLEGFTMGELAKILKAYEWQVEIDTRSGIIEKDAIKIARWQLMANLGANNPLITEQALRGIAQASNLDVDFDQPQQAQQANIPQAGMRAANELLPNLQ